MPPLEAKKSMFARVRGEQGPAGEEMKLMFMDVRKAHLNPICEDAIYVRLPEEFGGGKGGRVVRLKRWLYGMRGARLGRNILRGNWRRWDSGEERRRRRHFIIQGGN